MADFASPLLSPADWTLTTGTAVLPSTTRYGSRRVATLIAAAQATGASFVAPALALVRVHADPTGGVVLELEPMPFSMQTTLARLGAGLPSFYVGIAAASVGDFSSIVNTLVPLETTLRTAAVGETVWLAIVAQERITLPAATWATRIRDAMDAAMNPSPTWTDFTAAVVAAVPDTQAPVFVLDACGRLLTGVTIDVQVGASTISVTFADSDGGDLQRALIRSGLTPLWASTTSATLSIGAAPSSHRWVQFATGTRSNGSVTITPADPHVLFTDLDVWFAPQHVQGVTGRDLPRFTYGNRLDFFIDGSAFFRDLVAQARTLRAATDRWLIISDWGFQHDLKLGPRRAPSDSDPTFVELLEELCAADPANPPVEVRLLLSRFIQIEDNEALWVAFAVLAILSVLYLALGEQFKIAILDSDSVGLFVLLAALIYLAANIPGTDLRSLEPNVGGYDAINGGPFVANARAVWSRNPATLADNPHATEPLPFELEDAGAIHFGIYHMKSMAVRRDGELVAWTGGMDLVGNRRDDPRRLAEGPYHDLQARVEGPAAEDIAYTLRDRWTFDADRETDIGSNSDPSLLPVLDIPQIAPLADGRDIAQVARTYPRVGDPARELTFAPNGDFTIHDTVIQAINQAREYIYIEDQYFNPGAEYRDALLAALANIERLVVIVPTFADQPLGDLHRREFIEQLQAAAPSKVLIRAPIRRLTMPPSRRRASYGRVVLHSALAAVPGLAEEIVLGPDSRLPNPPFWLVIDGETMFATELMPGLPSDAPGTRRYHVKRGSDAAPGIHTRAHAVVTPAAVVSRTGIYVHAKMMIVDDVFVSIGSANLNRRGHKHDGEGNIFTVPEHLRQTSSNFARRLRTELWAAHLDLPLMIARPLLHDPIRASALFLREYQRGNRAIDVDLQGLENVVPTVITPGASFLKSALAILGLSVTASSEEGLWNSLADPTTEDL
jgi:phosphatidylserine/phosphatidylglycerophosphate/cardiolipin synthase-like enzyme